MSTYKNEIIDALESKSAYIIGILTCILIFFHAKFSFNQLELNLNLADVLSILTACVFMLEIKNVNIQFILPHVYKFLIFMLCAFAFAFLNGALKFGFTSYIFVSKFLGLFILLGYMSIGAAFKSSFGHAGVKMLVQIMIATLLTIMAIKICLNLLYFSQVFRETFIINPILSGYANNRNAFSLQLLCAACLSLIYLQRHEFATATLLAGVVFTYSRSALITMFILTAAIYFTHMLDTKKLFRIILFTVLTTAIIFTAQILVTYGFNVYRAYLARGTIDYMPNPVELSWNLYSYASSNAQRLYTLIEGTKLWFSHPLTGIGLGGFVQHELAKNQIFLVIHNTFLWILVEFGILGASVFIWYTGIVIRYFYMKYKTSGANRFHKDEKALALILLTFACMASAHEMFYQRIIWLIIGLLVTIPYRHDTYDKTGSN